ncbi:MAG TPA: hypothetical protein RMH99_31280 [Sandaracinaceae bacterium LLY-WYZ-13_1]|nr:hypothetical protein [Sandaracinaceae bacterium LLY-WYZ-13_1]
MRRLRSIAAALLALFAAGCIDIDFDPPHLVKSTRMLALSATPPEVAFGEDVVFEVLVVEADGTPLPGQPGVELRWTVCVSLNEVVNALGLGSEVDLDDTCDEGGDDLVVLGSEGLEADQARLPGEVFTRLLASFMGGAPMMPAPDGGGDLDPELLETLGALVAEVGAPLRVQLEVYRDGVLVEKGFKRFAITQRDNPTTNPPPPRFRVGETWVSARDGGDPHVCVPEERDAVLVPMGSEVELDPDDGEEAWLEEYPVVTLGNSIQINEESAFYSWFTTAGEMSDDVTQRPLDEVTWTTPQDAGPEVLWVVVRDGHLGMSWCRVDVEVQ